MICFQPSSCTLKFHDISSGSTYSTNRGSSTCQFILLATIFTDPKSPCKNLKALANSWLFPLALKRQLIINMLNHSFSDTRTRRKSFLKIIALTPMKYNLNQLNLEYAALKPALKIKTAPQYHKCKQKQLC